MVMIEQFQAVLKSRDAEVTAIITKAPTDPAGAREDILAFAARASCSGMECEKQRDLYT